MEIPSDVLSKLVCDNCDGHLSRGPVLMLADGKSRCGRCIEPEETASRRNVPYEELAKLMIFPCRYREEGCDEKLKFEENQRHEEACGFRPFVCPIAESGQCEWFGGRGELLDHCRAQHPRNVVQNAFSLKHNIINSSLHNYLLSAFKVLFLIQTKVCVTSRKIYHSVRLIGDPQRARKYKFNIEMKNNGKRVSAPGNVAPPGCLALQEDTAVAMGINSLLELLGDFRDSVFKINVRCMDHVTCGKCKVSTEPVYRDFTGDWWCRRCAPARRACKNTSAGCTRTDIDVKRSVHERYFCSHSTKCPICKLNITDVPLDVHYTRTHANITHRAGTEFKVTRTSRWQWCIISTDFGNVLCVYYLDSSDVDVCVCTQLVSEQLYRYRCELVIKHPVTGRERTCIPVTNYQTWCDWYLDIPTSDTYSYIHFDKCHLTINFVENETIR